MAEGSGDSVVVDKFTIHFLDLPHEIIDLILQNDLLDISDICRMSQTCTILNTVCQNNEIWRRKLQQRWPGLVEQYCGSCNWLAEFQKCHVIGQNVRHLVANLSHTYYNCEEVSEDGFESFVSLEDHSHDTGEIVLKSLMEIIHDDQRHCNLTKKYYAAKVVRYFQQHNLRKKWQAHLDHPPNEQFLETGAVLLAQWCQPTENINVSKVYDRLNQMASAVIAKCPESIASKFTQDGTPADDWSPGQERMILEIVNSVLFQEYRLQGNAEDYYEDLNSYIDKVLYRGLGIPITLAIVYSAISRRLGIKCQLIDFPLHVLLKWREHPMALPKQQYTYIDAFQNGKFYSEEELPGVFLNSRILSSPHDSDIYLTVNPRQVYERMCRNLIHIGRQQSSGDDSLLCLRNALDLALLLSPHDIDMLLLSVRINLHLNINHSQVSQMLRKITELDQEHGGLVEYLMDSMDEQVAAYEEKKGKTIIAKLRSEKKNKKVLFSVGLVMHHKRYNYMCVIYGWDPECKASKEWIQQMGVDHLPHKHLQPFYNVLVEDGSSRYAAQENLESSDEVSTISHPEVGKFFERFTGTRYVANAEKQSEYPEDRQETERTMSRN